MKLQQTIAILGGGNIGTAIAKGLIAAGKFDPEQITLTRRHIQLLEPFARQGFHVTDDNHAAVQHADIIIIAVLPQQFDDLVREIGSYLDPQKQIVISVVTGVTIARIVEHLGKELPVIRAMPNTGIAVRESMTCLAANHAPQEAIELAKTIFDSVGQSVLLDESLMIPATALGACGIAFFLRAIRAASQGGIEIGFHPDEALQIAAQTAKGAATLMLDLDHHPEMEIDKVTSPKGCTIAGLNEMEHQGFSSALIRGIVTSAEKAARLYRTSES